MEQVIARPVRLAKNKENKGLGDMLRRCRIRSLSASLGPSPLTGLEPVRDFGLGREEWRVTLVQETLCAYSDSHQHFRDRNPNRAVSGQAANVSWSSPDYLVV